MFLVFLFFFFLSFANYSESDYPIVHRETRERKFYSRDEFAN